MASIFSFLFEASHTPSGKKGEDTQCSWQTLWLHAEYTSYATVHTELVWPLLYFFSFFLSTWDVILIHSDDNH